MSRSPPPTSEKRNGPSAATAAARSLAGPAAKVRARVGVDTEPLSFNEGSAITNNTTPMTTTMAKLAATSNSVRVLTFVSLTGTAEIVVSGP